MGGMTSNGRSWRLSVSPDAPFSSDDAANNVLEFIALAITLKTEIDELKKQKLTEEVILALSDNTSAIHWVFKTGRVQQNSKYFQVTNFVARSIATWLMQSNNFICTQHIPGIHNFVTDLLSFEGTVRVRGKGGAISDKINPLTEDCPPNDVLTDRILSTCPQLVPAAFQICPLENETLCWALQAGQLLALSWTRKQNKTTKGSTEPGGDGQNFAKNAAEEHRHCFKEYAQTDVSFSSKPSLSSAQLDDSTEVDPLLDTIRHNWQHRLLQIPGGVYHRRFGCVSGNTPCTTKPTKNRISVKSQNCF